MPNLAISWEINITSILSGVMVLLGFVVAAVNLRGRVSGHDKELETLARRADEAERSTDALRDELLRDFVRRDALREVEDRLTRAVEKIEHSVRNTLTTTLGQLLRRGGEA